MVKAIIIQKSKIGQFEKGVFAHKNFKTGDIVIKYTLKPLTQREYQHLPPTEKVFTHKQGDQIYLYSIPERYVNHSSNPNTRQDLTRQCDVAVRNIKKGEEITTDATKDDA